jgi:hypothetical protein
MVAVKSIIFPTAVIAMMASSVLAEPVVQVEERQFLSSIVDGATSVFGDATVSLFVPKTKFSRLLGCVSLLIESMNSQTNLQSAIESVATGIASTVTSGAGGVFDTVTSGASSVFGDATVSSHHIRVILVANHVYLTLQIPASPFLLLALIAVCRRVGRHWRSVHRDFWRRRGH